MNCLLKDFVCQKSVKEETNAQINCQRSSQGESDAHKDKRNQNNWICARSLKGNVKLDRNQTGALVTTHTICDKVPAVPLAGALSFLTDEFNQILCSAL